MAGSASVRREMRFEAKIGAPLPDLRALVGRTVRRPEQRLNTAYFDSVDGRLRRLGLALRHTRTLDESDGDWVLSMPVGTDDSMERFERSWEGPREAVPSAALAVLRGVLRHEPLRQLVELDTRRQRLMIHDDGDEFVAELDDDLVAVSGGPQDGSRFREVELELQSPGPWNCSPVVACLTHAGLTPGTAPTWARATRPAGSPVGEITVTKSSTLTDILRAQLQDGFRRLVDHDWRLRNAFPDVREDDAHQARVATRRLRSNLKTLGGVLDPVWLRHVRDDLKWLGTALGDVRNVDVLASNLPELPDDFHRALVEERATAVRALRAALESERYLQLLDRLTAASERPPLAGGEPAECAQQKARHLLPGLTRARWRAVRRQVRKAQRLPSPESLHRVRIKAKQLRYAAEAATPVVGRPARRLARAAEQVQTDLGEHHDAVAAEAWLRIRAYDDGGTGPLARSSLFEAGVLAAEANGRRAHFEREWQRSWRKLADPKRRRWVH